MPFANHLLITCNFQAGSEPQSEQLNQENEQADGQLPGQWGEMEHYAHMHEPRTIKYLQKNNSGKEMNNTSYFPAIAVSVGVLVDALQFQVTLNPH